MPLGHNRDAVIDSNDRPDIKPGTYEFKVDDAEEVVFNSGNKGLKVILLVAVGNRDVKCYCNFVYMDSIAWRLEQFYDAVDLDYRDEKLELWDITGKTGKANFKVDERGYLKADKFWPVRKRTATGVKVAAAQLDDDKLPF
jgi:hypothetical protein